MKPNNQIIILTLAILASMTSANALSPQDAPVVRTLDGVRYEVPAGWEWIEFDGNNVTIQHLATKSGEKGKERSPNRFEITRISPGARPNNNDWKQLDRDQRRMLENGAVARWKAGPMKMNGYRFLGEVTIGSNWATIDSNDGPTIDTKGRAVYLLNWFLSTPSFDVSVVEAAFLRIAETLREVPESTAIYHPSLSFAADKFIKYPTWFSKVISSERQIRFGCFTSFCGEGSNTWIYAYPSSVVFPDTGKALVDITGHFEKAGLKIGEVRRAEVPDGEVLWTEQPGSNRPFLGAARRDGRYFFVIMLAGTSVTLTNDAVREDFLAVAKSVRAWDGK